MSTKIKKTNTKPSTKPNTTPNTPITFQVVDYFDEDKTNRDLLIENENEEIKIPSTATNIDKKVLGWWNWYEKTFHENVKNYHLYLFGKSDKKESVCTHTHSFTPYLYVQIPKKWKKKSKEYTYFQEWVLKQMWMRSNKPMPKNIPILAKANQFVRSKNNGNGKNIKQGNNVSTTIGDDSDRQCEKRWSTFYKVMKNHNLVDRLWYYVGVKNTTYVNRKLLTEFLEYKKFPLMRLVCYSKDGFYNFKSVFEEKKKWGDDAKPRLISIPKCNISNKLLSLFEADINPICRFTDHADVEGCGWITVSNYKKARTDLTHCVHDIDVKWSDIKVNKKKDGLAKMVMGFYDIECDSSHGDFPQASKTYVTVVRQILDEYQRLYKLIIKGKDTPNDIDEDDLNIDFTKKLLRSIFQNGNEEHNMNQLFWKRKSNLFMDEDELYDKDRQNHLPTVRDCFRKMLKSCDTRKAIQYITAIDEVVKIQRGKYTSKKMAEYIATNIEQVKIDVFKKNNGNIIKECAVKIHDLISTNFVIQNLSDTELGKEKEKLIDKCTKILDKYLPPIEGDPIIQIATSMQKQNEDDIYRNHILVLKGCNKIAGADVVNCDTEEELILKWVELLNEEDIDLLLGYNNYGFDFPYLWNRAKELGILDKFRKLSKFKDRLSQGKFKNMSSSAMGDNKWFDIDHPGRVQIDIMKVLRNDVTKKLDMYKLDFVASVFMRGKIKDILYENNYTIFKTDSLEGVHSESYIKLTYTKCHTNEYYGEGKNGEGDKFQITEILEDGSGFKVKGKIEIDQKLGWSWTMAKDDVSPQDIFRLQKQGPEERTIIAKYCIKDVVLCVELCKKLKIVINNISMANVCGVPFSWIFKRGQTAKTYSLAARFCREKDFVIPTLYKGEKGSYEGAVVLKPYPGIYTKKPIAVLDFGSLYPSIIIDCNMSHETLVKQERFLGVEGGKLLNELGYEYKDIEHVPIYKLEGKKKYKIGEKTCRFIQPKKEADGSVKIENRGIVPQILMKLLQARKDTRAKIKYKTLTMKDGTIHIGLYNKSGVLFTSNGKKISIDKDDIIEINDIDGDTQRKEYVIKPDPLGRKKKYVGVYDNTKGTLINDKKEVIIVIKEDIESIKDTFNDFMKGIFDAQQLAFKVSANSVYGLLGASVSPIYCPDIAASTTTEGRRLLTFAGDFTVKHYQKKWLTLKNLKKEIQRIYIVGTKVVYGDTDSIFVYYDIEDEGGNKIYNREAVQFSIEISLIVETHIKEFLGYPHKLEYEKTFWPFILISKKRYAGDKYEFNPWKKKQTSMGLVTKRRDNAKIVKYVFGGILDIIMGELDIDKAITFLQKCIRDILNGKFTFDKFIITKSLKAYYAEPNRIAHKVLAERMGERDPGNKPKPNQRLPYAYFEVPGGFKKGMLQGDRIEHPKYIQDNNLQLDYKHYITNQVQKPVCQIFGLTVEKLDQKYGFKHNEYYYDNMYDEILAQRRARPLTQDGKTYEEKTLEKIKDMRSEMANKLLFQPVIRDYERTKGHKLAATKWAKYGFFQPKSKSRSKCDKSVT